MTQKTVYYLPGAGGQLATGLGQALLDRGYDVTGRETRGAFRSLPFEEQVQSVVDDLQTHFWHEQAQVICNSFGAYLFLQAQAQMPAFVGKVLLLSPIVGEFTSEETRTTFSPPRPHKLKELAEAGQFNAPARCEIHVGEEDWQSIPANVEAFGRLTGGSRHGGAAGGAQLGQGIRGYLAGSMAQSRVLGLSQAPTSKPPARGKPSQRAYRQRQTPHRPKHRAHQLGVVV